MKAGVCAYCDKPAEGRFSIHRDGFVDGPEVDLCDECGGHPHPTVFDIWERISQAQSKPRKAVRK